MTALQARANAAVEAHEAELPKPWSDERSPIAVDNENRNKIKSKAERVGSVRTAISLLEKASKDFNDEKSMKNFELRDNTVQSFTRVGMSNPYLHHFMKVAATRIAGFNQTTKEHHDGRYDGFDPVIVFQLTKAALIHWHKTDEDTLPHLIETLKEKNMAGFKYDVAAKLDTKSDNQLLADAKKQAEKEQKDYEKRVAERDFKLKMEKARKIKSKRNEEDELLKWLSEQEVA